MASLIKKLFNYKKRRLWGVQSPQRFVNYLRNNGVVVGKRVNFRYPKTVTIDMTRPLLIQLGDDLDINANFTIMTHDFSTFVFRNYYKDFVPSSGEVKIGNNIYFGRNVTVLKGVSIGDNCIIGAGSLVTNSIPCNCVAAGVPCKVICSLDDYYKKRKKKSITESIQYAKILIKRKGNIKPSDLTEEWAVFMTKEDYFQYPEFKINADKRLGKLLESWLIEERPINGFSEFVKLVKDNNEGTIA